MYTIKYSIIKYETILLPFCLVPSPWECCWKDRPSGAELDPSTGFTLRGSVSYKHKTYL